MGFMWPDSRAPPKPFALLLLEIPGESLAWISIPANFLVWNFLNHTVQGLDLRYPFFRDTQNHPLGPLFQGVSFSLLVFLFTEASL